MCEVQGVTCTLDFWSVRVVPVCVFQYCSQSKSSLYVMPTFYRKCHLVYTKKWWSLSLCRWALPTQYFWNYLYVQCTCTVSGIFSYHNIVGVYNVPGMHQFTVPSTQLSQPWRQICRGRPGCCIPETYTHVHVHVVQLLGFGDVSVKCCHKPGCHPDSPCSTVPITLWKTAGSDATPNGKCVYW